MSNANDRIATEWNKSAKVPPAINNGIDVVCQRWDRSGKIVECLPHRQYKIKLDGTGRLTLRNRRHLLQDTQVELFFHPFT